MVARIRLKKCHYFRNMSFIFLQQQVQNHVDEAIFRRYSLEMTKIEFKNSTNTKNKILDFYFQKQFNPLLINFMSPILFFKFLSTSLCACLNFDNKQELIVTVQFEVFLHILCFMFICVVRAITSFYKTKVKTISTTTETNSWSNYEICIDEISQQLQERKLLLKFLEVTSKIFSLRINDRFYLFLRMRYKKCTLL